MARGGENLGEKGKLLLLLSFHGLVLYSCLWVCSLLTEYSEKRCKSYRRQSPNFFQSDRVIDSTIAARNAYDSYKKEHLKFEDEAKTLSQLMDPKKYILKEYYFYNRIFLKMEDTNFLSPLWMKYVIPESKEKYGLFAGHDGKWVCFSRICPKTLRPNGLRVRFRRDFVQICNSNSDKSTWFISDWPLPAPTMANRSFTPKRLEIDGISIVMHKNEIVVGGKLSLSTKLLPVGIELRANLLDRAHCKAMISDTAARHTHSSDGIIYTVGFSRKSKFQYEFHDDESYSMIIDQETRKIRIEGSKSLGTIVVSVYFHGYIVLKWDEKQQKVVSIVKRTLPIDWIVRIAENSGVLFSHKNLKYPMFTSNFFVNWEYLSFAKEL